MDIINKHSSRWHRHLFCTGGVHTSFGCGSMMNVEVSDLFYAFDYRRRKPERLVAFQCPPCGLGTVVAREGSEEWTKWFDNLYRRNPLQEDDPHGTETLKALYLAFTPFVCWSKSESSKKALKNMLMRHPRKRKKDES